MSDLLRIVVVDDDATARRRLRVMLEASGLATEVRECVDGSSAVATIQEGISDLVFLDVQMPGMSGFDVVHAIGPARMPPVIFTTGFAEYAVRAFEAYALDYLLKPFDEERLSMALDRGRERVRELATMATRELDARLLGLLEHLKGGSAPRYPDAIAVKSGTRYVVLRATEVDWIEADGNYSRLYVQKKARLLAKSLAVLEKDVLNPSRFVRVHRSAIVNLSKVMSVEPEFHGDATLVLYDGTRVNCSRRYRKRLDERLYFTT